MSWDSREAEAARIHRARHQRGESCQDDTPEIIRGASLSLSIDQHRPVRKLPKVEERNIRKGHTEQHGAHTGLEIGHVQPARTENLKNHEAPGYRPNCVPSTFLWQSTNPSASECDSVWRQDL